MATWTNEVTTSSGGNISLVLSGGYNVSRSGPTITYSYGVRFKQSSSTWTSNSICARYGGSNYYAQRSTGSTQTSSGVWYYATSTSTSVKQYTSEATPFSGSTTASGVEAGSFYVSIGTAWNAWTPSANKYTYGFYISYPAAASYSVVYIANEGTGAPTSQTKYQGYNLTLSSTVPTRSGYAFDHWYGSDGGTYYANSTFSGDYHLTLTAVWTPTNPVFTAPGLSRDETTISWNSFSLNTASNVYYQLDSTSGSWISLGTNTTTGSSGSVSGLTPGSSHTVYFKAVNSADNASTTTHSLSISLYYYPYITGIAQSTIDIGSTQTISLYNPLNRSTRVTVASSNYSNYVDTTSTSVSLVIPTNMANDVSKDTTHTCSVTYTSNYNNHTSTYSGTVNLSSTVGAPTISSSLKESFIEIGDIGTFTLSSGGTEYPMSNATGSTSKYLQGYSKLKYKALSANNPFSAQYGASISNYKIQINSKTATTTALGTQYYEGSSGGVTSSSSAVVMTANNTYTLTISATDNRGFTSSYTKTFTAYPYNKPSLGTPQMVRNDGYGTATTLTVSGAWCSNMNGIHLAKQIILYYKETSSTTYTSYSLYSDAGSSTTYKALAGTYNLSSLTFDSDKAYNIYIVATDCFDQTSTSAIGGLSLGTPLVFMDTEQQAIGINCFPSSVGLYVNGTSTTTGNIFINGIRVPTITKGTADPSGGVDGDVYIKYS